MIFSRADRGSLSTNQVINSFALASGLQENKDKSTQIFAGVPASEVEQLIRVTGFRIGTLPMRYLGVPLISNRLSHIDCVSIVEKIKKRLAGWKTRPLSFARRLTLIKFVLQGCYIYWARIFGLLGNVNKEIEYIFARFL